MNIHDSDSGPPYMTMLMRLAVGARRFETILYVVTVPTSQRAASAASPPAARRLTSTADILLIDVRQSTIIRRVIRVKMQHCSIEVRLN